MVKKHRLLEYLVRETGMSEEEVIEEKRRQGYEPFHIGFGEYSGKISFRKKRVRRE